jgi:hypothetical protein
MARRSPQVGAPGSRRAWRPRRLPAPPGGSTICDMRIIRVLRALKRRVTPPGNRGSLDSTYRQSRITGDGTNVSSPMATHQKFPPS